MADTYFALLQRKIDEYEEDIKTYLSSGQAEDMEKYYRIVCLYDALQYVRQDINDLEKRYIEE